jgi:hypothetical protein
MSRVWPGIIALLLPVAASAQKGPPIDARSAAAADTSLRIVVSLAARRLWVVDGVSDTGLSARVAVGSGKTLRSATQSWTFRTPRGVRTIVGKEVDPVWVRPDWSYLETARKHGLRLEYLDPFKPRVLSDGSSLVVRERLIGVLEGGVFAALPLDDEVVFNGVLFVPPVDAQNRRVAGQLGRYRLNLGDGIGLHGTPDTASIGRAVTHGCLRLGDADLEWIYERVPVGTRVYIF